MIATATTMSPTVMAAPTDAARMTTGRPPMPWARRWASARPTSCSRGMKNPGPATKMTAQNAENAAAGSPVRAFSETTTKR